jgi:hypothetical protein
LYIWQSQKATLEDEFEILDAVEEFVEFAKERAMAKETLSSKNEEDENIMMMHDDHVEEEKQHKEEEEKEEEEELESENDIQGRNGPNLKIQTDSLNVSLCTP